MKKFTVAIFLLLFPLVSAKAQNGKIKTKGFQDITVTNLTGDLDFGSLIYNQGMASIGLTDPKTVVLKVEGKENQMVRVSFTSPGSLMLDANNSLPFTLEAAYNDTGNNDPATAQTITNPSSVDQTFKLSKNKGKEKTGEAYLYIFGSVNVGFVRAGTYTGTINVFVQYD